MDRLEAYIAILDGKKVKTCKYTKEYVDCYVDEFGNVHFIFNRTHSREPLECAFYYNSEGYVIYDEYRRSG